MHAARDGRGQGCSRCVQGRAIRGDRKWCAAHHRDDACHLPPADNCIANTRIRKLVSMSKWQLVGKALLVVEPAIKICRTVVLAPVGVELEASVVIVVVVEALTPGERTSKSQP